MDPTETPRIALGKAIRDRREHLGLTIKQAAERAGMGSTNTWSSLERGDRVRGLALGGADRALRWAPGSSRLILEGGEPLPLETDGARNATAEEQVEATIAALQNPGIDWGDPDLRDLYLRKALAIRDQFNAAADD